MVDYFGVAKISIADSIVNSGLTALLEQTFPKFDPNKPFWMVVAEVIGQSIAFALVNIEVRSLFPNFYAGDPTGGLFISFFINTMDNFNQKVMFIKQYITDQFLTQLSFTHPLAAGDGTDTSSQ